MMSQSVKKRFLNAVEELPIKQKAKAYLALREIYLEEDHSDDGNEIPKLHAAQVQAKTAD